MEDNRKKDDEPEKWSIDGMMRTFSSRFKLNITFKLTFSNVLVLLLMIIGSMLVLKNMLFYLQYVSQKEELEKILSVAAKTVYSSEDIEKYEFKNKIQLYEIDYALSDPRGSVVFITNTAKNYRKNFELNFFNSSFIDKPECITAEKELKLSNGNYKIVFFKTFETTGMSTKRFIAIFSVVTFVMVFFYALWSSRITQSTLKPIGIMTETVKRISAANMSGRLDIKGSKDELRELAQTFNEMMDNIQIAYEKQKQFVSDASHELRTPISIIRGYADMLERWGKEDRQILIESIDAIKEETLNMQVLVEKLLFFVRNERNSMEINVENINPDEIIRNLLDDYILVDKNHVYSMNLNFEKDIIFDRQMFIQLIRIFVDNSRKYTPNAGEITVSTHLRTDGKSIGGKSMFVLEIEDSGIGIDKENMEKIFDRFFKVDESRTRRDYEVETVRQSEKKKKVKSFGLGLSIARVIVDAHGGRIEVESDKEKGSIFRIIV